MILPPERIERLSGFGMRAGADGYAFRPTIRAEIARVFEEAQHSGRRVVLRGSGKSYGDAAYASEALVLDLTRMDRILNWDPQTGVIEIEGGVTLASIWRHTLEDGWWLPVVSGTMFPTIGGALAMNIHGKNHYIAGSLGEHVIEMEFITPSGATIVLKPEDDLFRAAIGSAGLLGVITRVKLQMKRVHSGDVRVLPVSCSNWAEQFQAFDEFLSHAVDVPDYFVSWVDCLARGSKAGRGQIHAAWYTEEPGTFPASLRLAHQELPDAIFGFPKSRLWRVLKPMNNRFGIGRINFAKYTAGRILGDRKPMSQSLAGFSFLLDYVPNWQFAYLPGGLIQYQSFVPHGAAQEVFSRQIRMAQEAKLEPFLGVLKRHRPDPFLITWALDGFSFALDFKVSKHNWTALRELCWRMNDLVLDAGGRFYFAKDSTLRPEDVRRYLGESTLAEFRRLQAEHDPQRLLTSALAERVGLCAAS